MKSILIGMVVSLLIITGLTFNWGYNQHNELTNYSLYVESQFRRMFHDLVGNVENIQSSLSKVMVSGTPRQNVLLFTDLMYKCYDAQKELTQLPISHRNVSKTQKFLSQVGDFSMAMSRKCLSGKPLTAEDMETLEGLHNYSNYLSTSLLELQNELNKNGTELNGLIKKVAEDLNEANDNMLNTSFINVEERMQKYPVLIYDGPFSEHIKDIKPKLKGKNITEDEARRIAEEFLKNNKKYRAAIISETENTRFPAYIVELQEGDGNQSYISLAVAKKGGKIVWMLDTRPIGDKRLNIKEAVNRGKDFLLKNGYENMTPTYYEEYDGQLVINFAYMDDDIIVYTDLIKVKVSLEDGSIIGFESDGYLSNHHERDIQEPQVSESDARDMVSIDAGIEKVRLAIIPTEGSKEVLCYEFMTKYKKDTFLIYVNAISGEEEKILQVITKDEGVLMM